MNRDIWVSNAIVDLTLIKETARNFFISNVVHALGAMRWIDKGEVLPAERFLEKPYSKYPRILRKKLPDLSMVNDFGALSEGMAKLLRSVDLGLSGLCPTMVFQRNRNKPFEGMNFRLNFGNVL